MFHFCCHHVVWRWFSVYCKMWKLSTENNPYVLCVYLFLFQKNIKNCDKPVIRVVCYQNCAKTIYQRLTRAFLYRLQNRAAYSSFLFSTPIHRLLIDRFPFWKTRNNSSNHLVPNLPTTHVVTTHLGYNLPPMYTKWGLRHANVQERVTKP